MKKYFAGAVDYEKWKKDPFLGLIMFRQMQEGFGWETFKKFFREYQVMASKDPNGSYADTDEKKRDLWAETFSQITGRNIAFFFEKWGIPVSEKVQSELKFLPVWMFYNFPPIN